MAFKNREDAGRRLARPLATYAGPDQVVVLGIPRGGIPVAFEVAKALHAPLDIFLAQKLGVPGNEELAFGAMAAGDGRYLDQAVIRAAAISHDQIERITQKAIKKMQDRADLYREGRSPEQLQGKTILLVDDGVATGSSIYAAIHALRQMQPTKLIVAVPVAPASTCEWLRSFTDGLVCLHPATNFHAVGEFYEQFDQVTDDEVIHLLRRAHEALLAGAGQGAV